MMKIKKEPYQEKSIPSLEKFQSTYNDDLSITYNDQVFTKKLESKSQIFGTLLETIKISVRKQSNSTQCHNFTLTLTQMIQTNLKEKRSKYQKLII